MLVVEHERAQVRRIVRRVSMGRATRGRAAVVWGAVSVMVIGGCWTLQPDVFPDCCGSDVPTLDTRGSTDRSVVFDMPANDASDGAARDTLFPVDATMDRPDAATTMDVVDDGRLVCSYGTGTTTCGPTYNCCVTVGGVGKGCGCTTNPGALSCILGECPSY